MRKFILASLLLLSACGGTAPPPSLPVVQAVVAGVGAAVDAERATILAAVPAANQAAAAAAIDGMDAGVAAIVAVDPSKATADQVVAALQKFIDASGPLQADLPLPANVKAGIASGLAVARAILPLIPSMFPPVPLPPPPAPPVPAVKS